MPLPPRVNWLEGEAAQIVRELRTTINGYHPRKVSSENPKFEFGFSEAATEKWSEIYYRLEGEYAGKSGIHGAIVSRWKPAILRLSIIYAALDRDQEIQVDHIEAAEALWRYAAQSAIWAFGLNSGNFKADKILKYLARKDSEGATKSKIRLDCFNNNIATSELDEALAFMKSSGYAKLEGKRWYKV